MNARSRFGVNKRREDHAAIIPNDAFRKYEW